MEGLIRMMNTEPSVTGPVNLGNPNEMSVEKVADMIITMTSSNSCKVNLSLPSDDPKRRKPDISMADKLLKWKPVVGIEEGLRRTIEYYNHVNQNEK